MYSDSVCTWCCIAQPSLSLICFGPSTQPFLNLYHDVPSISSLKLCVASHRIHVPKHSIRSHSLGIPFARHVFPTAFRNDRQQSLPKVQQPQYYCRTRDRKAFWH